MTMAIETAIIPIGTVFLECSRFVPREAQARWRVERIVSLPNLPEHAAIRKLEPGGEERLITLQALANSGKYAREELAASPPNAPARPLSGQRPAAGRPA